MLEPDYFTNKSDKMLSMYQELEDWIMRDIANRLLISGEMSGTADRLIWKMQQMGASRRKIQKKIMSVNKMTKTELRALLQDAVLTSWWNDKKSMEQWMGNNIPKSPLKNPAVKRVMDAEYKKSLKTLENLTRTTLDKSQIDLINLLDEVEMRTASGVQSYSSAVCEVLDRYAGKGIVIYPTLTKGGKKYGLTIESAVNMIVRTSLNQTAAQITNQYIIEADTNYVLVSAHYGARTAKKGQPPLADHSNWQGKAYCIKGSEPGYPNLAESTGYNILPDGTGQVVNPLGLHGINCRHSHQPWDKSLDNPWIDENGNSIINDKKSKERYENEQTARGIERAIRKSKRQLLMKETEIEKIDDEEEKEKLQTDYERIAYRLRMQNKKYDEFCRKKDLQKQHERIKVADFKRKQAAKANGAATRYANKSDT